LQQIFTRTICINSLNFSSCLPAMQVICLKRIHIYHQRGSDFLRNACIFHIKFQRLYLWHSLLRNAYFFTKIAKLLLFLLFKIINFYSGPINSTIIKATCLQPSSDISIFASTYKAAFYTARVVVRGQCNALRCNMLQTSA